MDTYERALSEARRYRYSVNNYIEYEGAYAFYDSNLNGNLYGSMYSPIYVLKATGNRIAGLYYMGYGGKMEVVSKGEIETAMPAMYMPMGMGLFGFGFMF